MWICIVYTIVSSDNLGVEQRNYPCTVKAYIFLY